MYLCSYAWLSIHTIILPINLKINLNLIFFNFISGRDEMVSVNEMADIVLSFEAIHPHCTGCS